MGKLPGVEKGESASTVMDLREKFGTRVARFTIGGTYDLEPNVKPLSQPEAEDLARKLRELADRLPSPE